MDGGEVAEGRDIDVPGIVGADGFQVDFHLQRLGNLEGFDIDHAYGLVVGIVGRQAAGDSAGVRHIQAAVVTGDAFGLPPHFDLSVYFLGFQVDAVDLPLGILEVGEGYTAFVVIGVLRKGPGPGGNIGVVFIECDVPWGGDRDGRDFGLVLGGQNLDDAGVVDNDPYLVPDDDDVVADISETGPFGRIHLLERPGNVISVGHAQKIKGGIVGAHPSFVQHEDFTDAGRNAGDIDFRSGQRRVLGRSLRHRISVARVQCKRAAKQE